VPTTPVYGIPYPSLADPPNGPAQLQALATEVETEFVRVDAAATTLGGRVTTLENNLANVPLAYLVQTTVQSIPSAVFTAIQFNTEPLDTAGGHDNVTNNTRYTCKKAGKYLLGGGVATASAAGFRAVRWSTNGTSIAGSQMDTNPQTGAEWPCPARAIIVTLALNDYVELELYQDIGGGALNTGVSNDTRSSMTVVFLSV
jgi:hypothetical protein